MEVVYEALGRKGPECNLAITSAIEELEVMITENALGVEGTSLKIWTLTLLSYFSNLQFFRIVLPVLSTWC